MNIPPNPKISNSIPSTRIVDMFVAGERPDDHGINEHSEEDTLKKPIVKAKEKKKIKMYNIPFPVDVHRAARINSFNKGISLAEYIIQAVREYNAQQKN